MKEIIKAVAPPNNPEEGSWFEDILTGKIMFYRFGKWNEQTQADYDLAKSFEEENEPEI